MVIEHVQHGNASVGDRKLATSEEPDIVTVD